MPDYQIPASEPEVGLAVPVEVEAGVGVVQWGGVARPVFVDVVHLKVEGLNWLGLTAYSQEVVPVGLGGSKEGQKGEVWVGEEHSDWLWDAGLPEREAIPVTPARKQKKGSTKKRSQKEKEGERLRAGKALRERREGAHPQFPLHMEANWKGTAPTMKKKDWKRMMLEMGSPAGLGGWACSVGIGIGAGTRAGSQWTMGWRVQHYWGKWLGRGELGETGLPKSCLAQKERTGTGQRQQAEESHRPDPDQEVGE
jgi:hypothetical protein